MLENILQLTSKEVNRWGKGLELIKILTVKLTTELDYKKLKRFKYMIVKIEGVWGKHALRMRI